MRMLNPEIRREAEWLDGILTERDLSNLAARRNLPLYVDIKETTFAQQRRPCGAAAKRALLRCAELRLREARDLLRRTEEQVVKCRAELAAAEAREAA